MSDLPIESTGSSDPLSSNVPQRKGSAPALTNTRSSAEDGPFSEDEAEFLAGLRISVKQANAGQVTPIRPVLDELQAKYGDGD